MNRSRPSLTTRLLDAFWQRAAKAITSRPALVDWLIKRAVQTPYAHIASADGSEIYMRRWWLFNPYPHGTEDTNGSDGRRWAWLPSVRVHHILQADHDRHQHDHPWHARTIILRGCYVEERGSGRIARISGNTARLMHGEYHRIDWVPPGGVFTLFICGRKRGPWGFQVRGRKVPWREYVASQPSAGKPVAAGGIFSPTQKPSGQRTGQPALPICPHCGDARQVWRNQVTGRFTYHRAWCHTELQEPTEVKTETHTGNNTQTETAQP